MNLIVTQVQIRYKYYVIEYNDAYIQNNQEEYMRIHIHKHYHWYKYHAYNSHSGIAQEQARNTEE